MKKTYEVVYEDEDLVIVNKQAGIPVIPGRTSEMRYSLKYILKEDYGDIFIVHRIDQDTSGLVIFAKNTATHRSLNLLFQQHKIEKVYLAFIRGVPQESTRSIELPLKKLNNQNKSIVSKDGKPAVTSFNLVDTFGNISLLKVEIKTGRHHQIRAHMAHLGFPLLVDAIYGDRAFYLSEIMGRKYRRSKYESERPLLARLSLHAHFLSFIHPKTDKLISVKAEFPKDLKAVQNQLKKVFHK